MHRFLILAFSWPIYCLHFSPELMSDKLYKLNAIDHVFFFSVAYAAMLLPWFIFADTKKKKK